MTVWRLDLKRHSYSVDGRPVLFVDSSEKIERVQKILRDSDRVGVDTEFHGYNVDKQSPYGLSRPASMQLSCDGWRVDKENDAKLIFVPNWGEYSGTIRHFRKWLASHKEQKLFHNAKVDMHPLENIGCPVNGLRSDTLVKANINNSDGDHSLKGLMNLIFGIDSPDYREAFTINALKKDGTVGKKKILVDQKALLRGEFDWAFLDGRKGSGVRAFVEYAVKDPYYTVLLDKEMDDRLEKMPWHGSKSMLDYYKAFDLVFTGVLYRMERRGSYIDPNRVDELNDYFHREKEKVEALFFATVSKMGVSPSRVEDLAAKCKGKNGLLGSKDALGVLFTELLGIKLPMTAGTEKRGPKPSTKSEVLSSLRGKKAKELASLILLWRSISDKFIGTYMEELQDVLSHPQYNGRVHTTLKQTGAGTGRLSSAAPNLQNIPQRSDMGRKIRTAFVSEDPSKEKGDADMSQIELRLTAHFSKDPIMLEAYRNGMDLHSRTAVEVFDDVRNFVGGRPITKELLDEVKELFGAYRSKAKNTNFMIIYGGGSQRYADMNNASVEEGDEVIFKFRHKYKGVSSCINKTLDYCRRHGYVRTLLRRYVHFPQILSPNRAIRAYAERQCFNAVIQGSAADILKMSMILIDRDEKLRDWGVEMELQIHDELLFDVPLSEKLRKQYSPRIQELMGNPYPHFGMHSLDVETPAEIGFGHSWAEAH